MPFLSTAKRCAPLYVSANTVSGPVWPRSKKSGCARARPSSLHWARQDPLRRLRGIRAQPTGARLRAETAHLAHDRIPLPAGIQRASASATSGWPRPPVPCQRFATNALVSPRRPGRALGARSERHRGGEVATPFHGMRQRADGSRVLSRVVQLGRLLPGHRDVRFVMAKREHRGRELT
jgi:hypothetical protein